MGSRLRSRAGKSITGRVLPFLIGSMIFGLASQAQSFQLRTGCLNPDPRSVVGLDALAPVHVVREIKDPQTGAHWLILPNAANPAGPGRMVLAREVSRSDGVGYAEKVAPVVAIHLGDRVVVEEHTHMAEAYLEAVALEPAVAGASFHLRLKIGGKVMLAVAIAPGRAALMPSSGMPLAGMPSPEAQQ